MNDAAELNATVGSLVDKVSGWLEAAYLMLPEFAAALLVIVLSWLVAGFARRMVRGLLEKVSVYAEVNKLLSTICYVTVLAAGLFVALGILQLDKTVTSLLAGAGIVGLALAFAFQDIAQNFIAGIVLSIRRPFQNGDIIETNDHTGVVREINLRSTVLRTFQGQYVLIPNSEVFQNPITNYSQVGSRRIDLSCGVAYGDDLYEARRVALEAIEGLEMRDASREVEFFYKEFGSSSIDFDIRFWVNFRTQADYLHAQSEAIMRLKEAFDESGITIPFPIRTLDFGVVGGEKLSEALPPTLLPGDAPQT